MANTHVLSPPDKFSTDTELIVPIRSRINMIDYLLEMLGNHKDAYFPISIPFSFLFTNLRLKARTCAGTYPATVLQL